MLLYTESARSTAYFAAWAADADPERLGEAAALAAAAAAGGGRDVSASAIQAHGGIGFTWEADVHWFYKRAQLDGCAARRDRAPSRRSRPGGRGPGCAARRLTGGARGLPGQLPARCSQQGCARGRRTRVESAT